METTSVGIIIFISFSCLFSLSTAASYNESCASSGDCTGSYQECTNNTCTCTSGYFENGDATGCNAGLGSLCIDVLCHDSSAECVSGTCTCQSTHYVDNDSNVVGGTCTLKKSLGVECPDPTNGVKDTCADTNGECLSDGSPSPTYSCQCKSSYSNQGGTCIEYLERFVRQADDETNGTNNGIKLGDSCTNNDDCKLISNATCNGAVCICESGFYETKPGDGGSCQKRNLGETCTNQNQCNDANAKCTTTCQCNDGYYDSNGQSSGGLCTAKKDNGASCTNAVECATTNAECSTSTGTRKCSCMSGYYQVNVKTCSKRNIGETCSDTSQCNYSNSQCKTINGDKQCECEDGYFKDGNICSVKKELGKPCSTKVECKDGNAKCSGTCTCNDDYYDSNGSGTAGGQCNLKKDNGGDCSDNRECATNNAECSSGKCSCSSGYYQVNPMTCSIKKELGKPCSSVVECKDGNAKCSGSCTCNDDYYDSNGSGTAGGQCNLKKHIGSVCSDDIECATKNAECSSAGKCSCLPAYFQVNSQTCSKRYLGQTCGADSHCSVVANSVCSSGTCSCDSGYFTVGGACLKRYLGQKCGADSHCSIVANSECSSGTCSCTSDYFKVGGACLKRYLDQTCGADTHCSEVANSECSSKTCSCKSDFFRVNGACLKRQLGESCGLSTQCSTASSECSNFECQCLSTHFDSNGAQSSGSCILKVSLGQTCPTPTTYVPATATCGDINAKCTQSENSYTCLCTSYHYDNMDINNRKCTLKVGLGSHCPRSDACATANAGCVGETCICDSDYYDDNGKNTSGGNCRKRKPLDGICTGSPQVNIDQCSDPRAKCFLVSGMYKCTCIGGYHPENSQCVANKPLGQSCSNASECSDPSARCLVGKCTCDDNHYDDNGFPEGGTCYPMTKLQVADVEFPSVKTNEIVVSWLAPINYIQHIDGFTVEWKGTSDNAVESENVDSSIGSSTLTKGIVPGKAYIVTITSRNENTQQNSVRTTSKTKQQAAKPDIPSTLTTPDIDAVDQEIMLGWSAPVNGLVSGYRVILIDGVNEIVNESSTSSLTFTSTNTFEIKNGYRYNVSITSKSQVFEGSNYVPSETYEGEIKTLVQVPKTPRNVQVVDIEAKAFTVTWDIDGRSPGETNFTVALTADSPAPDITITKNGFDVRTHTFEKLEEYWNYSVVVSAATEKGVEQSDRTAKYRTHSAAPGKVSDLTLIPHPDGNYTRMKITWKAPPILQQNSVIKDYSFSYLSVEDTITKGLEKLVHISSESHKYEKVVDVVPESTYEFKVFATNQKNMTGDQTMKKEEAPAGVPPNIEDTGVTVINKDEVSNIGQTSFTVPLAVEFFEVETYGVIRATGLIACKKACEGLDVMSLSDFKSMTNWKTFSQGNMNNYRVTPEDWQNELEEKNAGNSRRKRSTVKEYTIGSGKCTSDDANSYCNAPLQSGTSYVIKAVSCTNGGCLLSKDYGPIATKVEPEKGNNQGMIIGIVVAVVVLVIVGAVVGFVLLRRRRGPGKMKPSSDSDDGEFTPVDPAISKIKRKRPFLLSDIEDYVNNMHKDSNLLFSSEYEDLKTLSPKHSCDAADREENRMRNRYINIIPFDHTRVKLSTNGEDDPCDYINANYLPGYTSPREYIGCQGPIPGTIDDFWRMTWEQNVSVIVMLTLCKEGQKIKCEQYWPEDVAEPKQYGDVIVEMTSYSNIRTYDYRLFKITNGNQTRVIKHFHFLSWLDFQANVHHDIILDFILQVRQHVQPPDTSGPMIVHCSAGVGRTGTYIALDHLMQFINEHDFDVQVDIFDMVLNLRENRQHMVQTEQQYVFIHDCVKEILERKRRNMENIYENEAFWKKRTAQDENIYQNEQQNLYANVAASGHEQNTEL